MSVSLVLPCYNPQPGWEEVVRSCFLSLQDCWGNNNELILVLDGHSDTVTPEVLSWLQQQLPQLRVISYTENRGKGYATRTGVGAATGDIIIYTDIDFPYTTASICNIYKALSSNDCDVAIGVKNAEYYTHVPVMRRIISRVLRLGTRTLLSMPITDTQCGLKGFKRPAAATFQSTTIDRYLFDLEFVYKCSSEKTYKVRAIPVTLKENVRFRSMNYRILLPEMRNFIRLLFNKNK
jgi:glycosyltransferase involved in cell wall biosynthesis